MVVRRYDRRSQEGRPNVQELQTACLVLNTAEYCHETASQVRLLSSSLPSSPHLIFPLPHPHPQLEERLQEKIAPELASRVTLEAEKDLFLATVSAALLALLHELELATDGAFQQMGRSPWRDAEFVSAESAYVGELTKVVQTVVAVVREGLEQKKYLRSVCDKIVGFVLSPSSKGGHQS